MSVKEIMENMRARMSSPMEKKDGFPLAVCLKGSVLTTCYAYQKQTQRVPLMARTKPQMSEDDCVAVPQDVWTQLEIAELRQKLTPPRVFVPRVNTHGIMCIYAGIEYYLRFRYILREKDLTEDRPLVHFLDLAGIETSFLDDGKIRFDFRRLDQSGLMFRKGKKNTPIPEMVLAVKPVRRNKWDMCQA